MAAVAGKDQEALRANESLWQNPRAGRGITSSVFYTNLRTYLKKARLLAGGEHIFRHSAAQVRRDAWRIREEVSRFRIAVPWL